MASWLTHLRIATHICTTHPHIVASPFLVGNIAPDSGRITSEGQYDPPKTITHFKGTLDAGFTIGDWPFYRDFLLNRPHNPGRAHDAMPVQDNHSFLLGYFCHLLTDNLWILHYGQLAGQPGFWETLAAIDTVYLKKMAGVDVPWKQMMWPGVPEGITEFLSKTSIREKFDVVGALINLHPDKSWFPLPTSLITMEQVAEFVEIAHDCFNQVVHQLENDGIIPDCTNSMLADSRFSWG